MPTSLILVPGLPVDHQEGKTQAEIQFATLLAALDPARARKRHEIDLLSGKTLLARHRLIRQGKLGEDSVTDFDAEFRRLPDDASVAIISFSGGGWIVFSWLEARANAGDFPPHLVAVVAIGAPYCNLAPGYGRDSEPEVEMHDRVDLPGGRQVDGLRPWKTDMRGIAQSQARGKLSIVLSTHDVTVYPDMASVDAET